jgi:hypothetical protein
LYYSTFISFLFQIRGRLSTFGVNPFDLSLIDHTKCPPETNLNFDINPDTFSPESIAHGVRKAGEKLGDGVEALANGAKKVYTAVTKDDDVEDLS